jgi:hypothetical protein
MRRLGCWFRNLRARFCDAESQLSVWTLTPRHRDGVRSRTHDRLASGCAIRDHVLIIRQGVNHSGSHRGLADRPMLAPIVDVAI